MNTARTELEDQIHELETSDLRYIHKQIEIDKFNFALGIIDDIEKRAEKDKEFLQWLLDRLIYVYRESENVDFVHKLRNIISNTGMPHYIYRLQLFNNSDELQVEKFEYNVVKAETKQFKCGSEQYIKRHWTETVFSEAEAAARVEKLNNDLMGPTAAALIAQKFPASVL